MRDRETEAAAAPAVCGARRGVPGEATLFQGDSGLGAPSGGHRPGSPTPQPAAPLTKEFRKTRCTGFPPGLKSGPRIPGVGRWVEDACPREGVRRQFGGLRIPSPRPRAEATPRGNICVLPPPHPRFSSTTIGEWPFPISGPCLLLSIALVKTGPYVIYYLINLKIH